MCDLVYHRGVMENQVQAKRRVTSTVVIGIFLTLMVGYCLAMLPIDLNEMLANMESSGSGAGAAAGQAIGGFFLALVVIMLHAGFFACIAGVAITTPFAILNVKHAFLKPVKITNIVYLGLEALVLATSIVKLVLLFLRKS